MHMMKDSSLSGEIKPAATMLQRAQCRLACILPVGTPSSSVFLQDNATSYLYYLPGI